VTKHLVDINVLLPLVVPSHSHHRIALAWFDGLAAGQAGLCRSAQLGMIRLLANRSLMGKYAIPAHEGWLLVERLLRDERMEFVGEPTAVESILPDLLKQKIPNGNVVGDAYLAAFAIASARRMVTLDAGFRNFPGLDLELLQ
jgi:toxin-antitoxin system PIN domain toxin